ncbi:MULTISPECIES: sulfatase [Haloferax]|uniref:Sulfatase-like hydrolase/transferase n=2 Tax=Haloferax TaxID=2251 RepID=A0A6G1Z3Q9_9EURY|nr:MULTISPECIES: sulfatase [Haloferax]KAB1188440.1 sulfatase [Haloferax sp. CBA1149]MRW81133.1 sulfatase-like hydrolase/transferase [Haloferax marinisediminis]
MSDSSPNVLLVVLDSLRAGNTSLHGYERDTTPFLNEFASRSSVYTQARSSGMTSLPSHTSLFTGLTVPEHGVHDLVTHRLKEGVTIWERLSAEYGYTTGVFSDNVNLTGDDSLASAFDHVVGRRGRLFPEAADPDIFFNNPEYLSTKSNKSKHVEFLEHCLSHESPVKSLANGAAKQLSKSFSSATMEQLLDQSADRFIDPFFEWSDSTEEPWAACINLMDTHLPFYPERKHDLWGGSKLQRMQAKLNPVSWKVYGGQITWDEWVALEDLYDGTIRQADHYLRYLVSELERRGELDDTLLVITSDHGEGFGETSRVRPSLRIAGHIVGLDEALLHVPLVVSAPGQTDGEQYDDLATLTNFSAAVESAVDGDYTGDEFVADGEVIVSGSTVDKKAKSKQRVSKYCTDVDRYTGDLRAVYEQRDDSIRKYLTWDDDGVTLDIRGMQVEVVDGEDPHEVTDRAFSNVSDAGVAVSQGETSQSTMDRLESLGYV